jgi:hypothetical protein
VLEIIAQIWKKPPTQTHPFRCGIYSRLYGACIGGSTAKSLIAAAVQLGCRNLGRFGVLPGCGARPRTRRPPGYFQSWDLGMGWAARSRFTRARGVPARVMLTSAKLSRVISAEPRWLKQQRCASTFRMPPPATAPHATASAPDSIHQVLKFFSTDVSTANACDSPLPLIDTSHRNIT